MDTIGLVLDCEKYKLIRFYKDLLDLLSMKYVGKNYSCRVYCYKKLFMIFML